jgi:hypothetical protein
LFFPEVDATLLTKRGPLEKRQKNGAALTPLEAYFALWRLKREKGGADGKFVAPTEDLAKNWHWRPQRTMHYLHRFEKFQLIERELRGGAAGVLYSIPHPHPRAPWVANDDADPSLWTRPWGRHEMGLYFLQRAAADRQFRARRKELARVSGWKPHLVERVVGHVTHRDWIERVHAPDTSGHYPAHHERLYEIQNVYPAPWFWFWLQIDESLWYRHWTILEMWLDLYEHCRTTDPFIASHTQLAASWHCTPSWVSHVVQLPGDRLIRRIARHVNGADGTAYSLNSEWAPAPHSARSTAKESGLQFSLHTFPFSLFPKVDRRRDKRPLTRRERWLHIVDRGRNGKPFTLPDTSVAEQWGCTPAAVDRFIEDLIDAGALIEHRKSSGPRPAEYMLAKCEASIPWFDVSHWLESSPSIKNRALTSTERLISLLKRNQAADPFQASGSELADEWNCGKSTACRFVDDLNQADCLCQVSGGDKGLDVGQYSFKNLFRDQPLLVLNAGAADKSASRPRGGRNLQQPGSSALDEFRHSVDFRTIVLKGEKFTLTTKEAQVVQMLKEAYDNGMPDLSGETILDRIGSGKRVRDVFPGNHREIYYKLIRSGERRGTYRLNVP